MALRLLSLLLVVTLIFAGCATGRDPNFEATYLLGVATSSFSKRDNPNAAWFVSRAATKPMGHRNVHQYFNARPDLIEPYFDGALTNARNTESQEYIEDIRGVLDILATLPGVPIERLNSVLKACIDATERIALLEKQKRWLADRVLAAQKAAQIPCQERDQCDQAFRMAEVFVSQHADMKIQVSTSSVIETHNATDKGKVALKVLRTPSPSNESNISLGATCRTDDDFNYSELCELRLLKVYTAFRQALLPFAKQK